MDIVLLVNNAGLFKKLDKLLDVPPVLSNVTIGNDPCLDMFECNAQATMVMCQIVMSLMIDGCDVITDRNEYEEHGEERTPISSPPTSALHSPSTFTRGGVVINVSSISSITPTPLFALYASTKVLIYFLRTNYCH